MRRPYHLLSELEATYFFLTERKGTTVEIQEQWPILDLDRTLELCTQFGVRHKYRGIYPEPFTIDFLITEVVGGELTYRAASIKSAKDAEKPEVRQRLAVEYVWCRDREIPWALVDTSAFDKTLLANLRFMRAWFRHHHEPDADNAERFAQEFHRLYATNVPLVELIRQVAKGLRLAETLASDVFRYCAWSDRIAVSLKHPLSLDRPLVLHQQS